MRRALIVFVAFGCLLSAVPMASAQFQVSPSPRRQGGDGRLEFGGFVGGLSLDQSLGQTSNIFQTVSGAAENVRFGQFFGFRTSYAFTPRLAAEFNVSRGTNPYTFTVDDIEAGSLTLEDQFEARQVFIGGNVLFHLTRTNVVPYVSGGAGVLRTQPVNPIAGFERVSSLDVNFGGGIKIWLSSPWWLGFRADVRYHTAQDGLSFAGADESPTGFEFTAGASVRLF